MENDDGNVVKVSLMNDDDKGIIKCSVMGLSGKVYKIPYNYIKNGYCDKSLKEELEQMGIYFLFRESDNHKSQVYIGKADKRKNNNGALGRIKESHKDKEGNDNWWTEAILLVINDTDFTASHLSYLENYFHSSVNNAKYDIVNKAEPSKGKEIDTVKNESKSFIKYLKIIMGVLGYKVFLSEEDRHEFHVNKKNSKEYTNENVLKLHIEMKKVKAKCNCISKNNSDTSKVFVVLEGSKIIIKDKVSLDNSLKKRREECIGNGTIVVVGNDQIGELKLKQEFSSPSAAAKFVLGSSVSGNEVWLTEDGTKLGDYIKEKSK